MLIKPIRYKSSDGLEIPAYLALPRGLKPKNLPTIILPHGGSWGRERWGYDSQTQFLANRGYAVLLPNFRGSTGYGKKFLAQHLGGRFQESLTPEVAKRLQEITVDPKTVKLATTPTGK
ncbi:MAG TPA: prolyl oligopeptidase family serine peptidase [Pyrinomonadaceae bacterium]|nr:prolyl oligopeptidase family serine peptidase [Pyrinomonadaceae bacterium]